MRGKYALRARSKREADGRLSAAVQEADQLRSRLGEIRRLRAEKEVFKKEIAILRRDLATGTSSRVRALEALLAKAEAEVEEIKAAWNWYAKDAADAVMGLIDLAGPKRSAEWWKAAGPVLARLTWLYGEKGMDTLPPEVRNALAVKKAKAALGVQ